MKKLQKYHLALIILMLIAAGLGVWVLIQRQRQDVPPSGRINNVTQDVTSNAGNNSSSESTVSSNSVETRKNDIERETDIKALHGQLEAYFAEQGRYPTLANINDDTWRTANMKGLSEAAFKDPDGSGVHFSSAPSKGIYAYLVAGDGDTVCNNTTTDCTKYTLTATLANGDVYQKTSLN